MTGTRTLEDIVKQIITVYNEELVEKLNFKHTTLWEVLIAKGVVATGDVEEAKVKYNVNKCRPVCSNESVYRGIYTLCHSVFCPSIHNFRDIELKFCIL